MTARRGSLYVGVFLVSAGAVTLAAAVGLVDPDAVAAAAGMLWPLAVIAIGIGLVLRRSPVALTAGVVAALVPGLALGATVVAAPVMPVPCTHDAAPVRQADTSEGAFGSAATVDLSLSCGEFAVTTQPGMAWRVDARDGDERRTDVRSDAGRLAVDAEKQSRRWDLQTGRVAWNVVLPTGVTMDLATELNAGRGRLTLDGARLGLVALEVNAADMRVDLTGATLQRLDLELNAGAAAIVLPTASFEGDLDTNAGSLEVCAPDQLGLRVRSTTALGSIDVDGLVQSGNAWESPDYATAPFKADLAIVANVGSVTINPEGGCK